MNALEGDRLNCFKYLVLNFNTTEITGLELGISVKILFSLYGISPRFYLKIFFCGHIYVLHLYSVLELKPKMNLRTTTCPS